MDLILGGNNASVAYIAVVIQHNHRFTSEIFCGYVEPSVLSQGHRIAKADSGCTLPIHLTREMKRQVTSLGREWVGQADPGAI